MYQGLKLAAVSAVLLVQPVAAQETHFSLSSSAFADNGIMALKYAGKNPANANCIGENVSPPLRWSNPPDGTRSYAIIMHDQEGRLGLGVTHWVAYGIPASTMALPEGAASDAAVWPAPGSEDTELGVLMGPEVRHGASEVHARVQA